ncbi:MAG: ferritin [Elusimicrobia bacterium]|jgi:ferritin|nr:ferritin [Elusimicrobiota bacterium]
MAIDKRLQDAINRQINRELWSAYLYLSMASYFDFKELGGFAAWMKEQAEEETAHAERLYDYLIDCGVRATMQDLETPPAEWGSPLEVFKETLKHEKKVTALIDNLMDIARDLDDKKTVAMLEWFVKEQEEEEESVEKVIKKIKNAGDDITRLDNELGERK